jgi:hypothetical protein
VQDDDDPPLERETCDRSAELRIAVEVLVLDEERVLVELCRALRQPDCIDRAVDRDASQPRRERGDSSNRDSAEIARTNASCAASFAASLRPVTAYAAFQTAGQCRSKSVATASADPRLASRTSFASLMHGVRTSVAVASRARVLRRWPRVETFSGVGCETSPRLSP